MFSLKYYHQRLSEKFQKFLKLGGVTADNTVTASPLLPLRFWVFISEIKLTKQSAFDFEAQSSLNHSI